MGWLRKLFLFNTVLVVGLGYLLYTPIPDGFSKPWVVRLAYTSIHVLKQMCSCRRILGLGEDYELIRTWWNEVEQRKIHLAGDDDSLEIRDTSFDSVPVRVYTPKGKVPNGPGFVFYHGGGWTVGSVDTYDLLVRRLAKSLNITFVSVEYRLAPEHIYPAPFDDCLTATKYFLKNAAEFGVNPTRIGIGGDSAGGNLAAAISLKLQDDKVQTRNKLQVLIYPVIQALDFMTPSYQANSDDAALPGEWMKMFWSLYLQGNRDMEYSFDSNNHTSAALKRKLASSYMDVSKLPKEVVAHSYVQPKADYGDEKLFNKLKHLLLNPYISPLMADDLSGLPPAYVFTGQHDVLRDEGIWYALRLKEAGVKVTHRHSSIAYHGIFGTHDISPEASQYVDELVDYIKKNL